MLKVGMAGVAAVLLAMLVAKEKKEFGIVVVFGGCILILTLAAGKIQTVIRVVKELEAYMGDGSTYIGLLLKMVGITYVAEFSANLCRDAGYGSVASQIEFYGKLMLLTISVPVLVTLIETIKSF